MFLQSSEHPERLSPSSSPPVYCTAIRETMTIKTKRNRLKKFFSHGLFELPVLPQIVSSLLLNVMHFDCLESFQQSYSINLVALLKVLCNDNKSNLQTIFLIQFDVMFFLYFLWSTFICERCYTNKILLT